MMEWQTLLRYAGVVILLLHGVIHIIGVLLYWQIAALEDFGGYKTTLLGGRVDVGDAGMRVFGLLWALALIGYVVAAYGLARESGWWLPVTAAVTVFSLALTVLDWNTQSAGPVVNVTILVALGAVALL